MRGLRNNINMILKHIAYTKLAIVAFLLQASSCKQEKGDAKLSAINIYHSDKVMKGTGWFVLDGQPGITLEHYSTIATGPGSTLTSYYDYTRVALNLKNGTFVTFPTYYNEPTTNEYYNSTIVQLKGSDSFMVIKSFGVKNLMDTNSFNAIQKLFLSDRNFSKLRELPLFDTTLSVNSISQLPDGRVIVTFDNGSYPSQVKKYISCYNHDLSIAWTKSLYYDEYDETFMAVLDDAIYIAQAAPYITPFFRVIKLDFTGKIVAIYNDKRGNYKCGQILPATNGYYTWGVTFVGPKSDFDFYFANVNGANTRVEEHTLNILSYLPDWNTSTWNVNSIFNSSNCSYIITNKSGYWFAFTYPNFKNNTSLALIQLSNDFKIKTVKHVAQNVGASFPFANQHVTLMSSNEQLFIIWSQPAEANNYFYVLDKDGNFINN